MLEFTITNREDGARLDQFLGDKITNHSRAELQVWIQEGCVKINQREVRKNSTKLRANQVVEITPPPPPEPYKVEAETFDYEILFEDDHLLVINKPPNLVIHPAPGHYQGTLVNALLSHVPQLAEQLEEEGDNPMARPGIVHRLDKDTSGALLIAKTPHVQQQLSAMFAARTVQKQYLAITHRIPNPKQGAIENMMGRHPTQRQKMAILPDTHPAGKLAITLYETVSEGMYDKTSCALVKVDLKTGRTHQIRVHLTSLKSPIIGDTVYGGKCDIEAERQMLHAWKLSFKHPVTHKEVAITAPIPADFESVMVQTGLTL